MNTYGSETAGVCGIVLVKRALYSLRRRFQRKAMRDRTVPVITGLKDIASPFPASIPQKDVIVMVKQDGREGECLLHVDDIAENAKPPVFQQQKGRLSLRIIVRRKDRFGQIINRVSKCIDQLVATMRREFNNALHYRRTGEPPEQPEPNTRKLRRWHNRFQAVRFSH